MIKVAFRNLLARYCRVCFRTRKMCSIVYRCSTVCMMYGAVQEVSFLEYLSCSLSMLSLLRTAYRTV